MVDVTVAKGSDHAAVFGGQTERGRRRDQDNQPHPGDSHDAGSSAPPAPLADRMRPNQLGEILGQDHLLGEGTALRSLVDAGELPSLILWGPPGCGKTTLARVLASGGDARFEALSAVMAGVKEIRAVVQRARHESRFRLRLRAQRAQLERAGQADRQRRRGRRLGRQLRI